MRKNWDALKLIKRVKNNNLDASTCSTDSRFYPKSWSVKEPRSMARMSKTNSTWINNRFSYMNIITHLHLIAILNDSTVSNLNLES